MYVCTIEINSIHTRNMAHSFSKTISMKSKTIFDEFFLVEVIEDVYSSKVIGKNF